MVISIENYDTYPRELHSLLHNHLSLFGEFTDFDNDVAMSFDRFWKSQLESGNRAVQQFNTEFLEILDSCWIEGYHLSRAFSPQIFLDHGLKRFEWSSYCKYMDSVFEKLNYTCDQRKDCFQALRDYYDDEGWGRNYLLSLFAPPSDYVLKEEGGDGYQNRYAAYIGGEFAENVDWVNNKCGFVPDDLRNNGNQMLVKFIFPFKDIITCDNCEYPQKFAANEILAILLHNERGIKTDRILFLAQLKTSIPPQNIKDVQIL